MPSEPPINIWPAAGADQPGQNRNPERHNPTNPGRGWGVGRGGWGWGWGWWGGGQMGVCRKGGGGY